MLGDVLLHVLQHVVFVVLLHLDEVLHAPLPFLLLQHQVHAAALALSRSDVERYLGLVAFDGLHLEVGQLERGVA